MKKPEPKCPYCGTGMILERGHERGLSYACPECWSESPFIQYKGGEDTPALCCEAALRRPLQKPLTFHEAIISEGPVWAESSIAGLLDDWFYVYGSDQEETELLTFGVEEGWIKSNSLYNKTWRAWATRPTDEERAAAQWEE